MENAGCNGQLGIPTLVVVFAHVAHMRRVVQPETEDKKKKKSRYFLTFFLVGGWGAS